MEVNSLFLIVKANHQREHCITKRKKKMNEKFVMHEVTFTLVQARLGASRYLCVFEVREDLDWGLG